MTIQEKNKVRELWLEGFNRVLLEQKVITMDEYLRMQRKIREACAGTSRK